MRRILRHTVSRRYRGSRRCWPDASLPVLPCCHRSDRDWRAYPVQRQRGSIMFDLLMFGLDWFGVAVFATAGALVASRKQMDLVGFVLLGTVTGIGGGSVRDALLGAFPVYWIADPRYLITCV